MKFIIGILVGILLSVILYISWAYYFVASFTSNGMGGGEVYKLDCSRGELYSGLKSFYTSHTNHQVPAKWSSMDLTKQPYYEDFEGVSFYFEATKTEPEEMYFVTLVSNDLSDTTYTQPSYVAVRIVTNPKGKSTEITKEEQQRTDRRFKEIVLDQFKTDSCFCNVIGKRE